MNDTDFQKYQPNPVRFGQCLSDAAILAAATQIFCAIASKDDSESHQLKMVMRAAKLTTQLINEL